MEASGTPDGRKRRLRRADSSTISSSENTGSLPIPRACSAVGGKAGCRALWYTIYLGYARNRPDLDVPRLDTSTSFRKEAYAALKRAITAMDIYDHAQEIRLDERQLSAGLGVSRTPIREAMTLLEQEGFVRTRPRRGIFIVRKTKREIVEMITVMAALESMAAQLAADRASEAEVAELHRLMDRVP